VEGGCKEAEPDGSGATAVSTAPLADSGDSTAGVSTGTSAAGFVFGFLVETLGIDKFNLAGSTGFQLPDVTGRHALDALRPE
jgi:hypothetical protein